MRAIVSFLLWLCFAWCGVAGEALPPTREAHALMSDIAAGKFREVPSGPVSGWFMTNETGQVFHRAELQAQGRPIIAIGAEAVPELVKWLSHTNMHVRYIAHYCLEQITGEEPYFPHFATLKQLRSKGYLKAAARCWSEWYAKRKPNQPAAGQAGIARLLTIEHHWPGLPEPDRYSHDHESQISSCDHWRSHISVLRLRVFFSPRDTSNGSKLRHRQHHPHAFSISCGDRKATAMFVILFVLPAGLLG